MGFPGSNLASLSKPDVFQQLCAQLGELVSAENDLVANTANAAALIYHSLPDLNWVGFYFAKDDQLVLGPFQGQVACTRIPFGKGVCGTAAAEARTIIVPDVEEFPGHIACDTASKSEMVIPLLNWGRLIGVLDLDSPVPNRFDEDDREGLESLTAVLVASVATNDLPDFNEDDVDE
jgi:L-methionine (R)-S-oxide reductase